MAELKYVGSAVNSAASQLSNVTLRFQPISKDVKTNTGLMIGCKGFNLVCPGASASVYSGLIDSCEKAVSALVGRVRSTQAKALEYSQSQNDIDDFVDSLSTVEYYYLKDNGLLEGIDKKISWTAKLGFGAENLFNAACTFGLGFAEGLVGVVEDIGDGAVTLLGSAVSGTADLFGADEFANTVNDWTRATVAVDHTGNAFDSLYADTEYGRYLQQNCTVFDGARGLGEGVGYCVGVKTLSAVIPGGPIAAATIIGFGDATERGYADGASLGQGLLYSTASAGWEAIQWGVGGKINELGKSLPKIGGTLASGLFKHGTILSLEMADAGLEGFIQPGLKMIYNYDSLKGDNFFEKCGDAFYLNGGWNTVGMQMLNAGIMYGAKEMYSVFKSKVSGKNNSTGLMATEDSNKPTNPGDSPNNSGGGNEGLKAAADILNDPNKSPSECVSALTDAVANGKISGPDAMQAINDKAAGITDNKIKAQWHPDRYQADINLAVEKAAGIGNTPVDPVSPAGDGIDADASQKLSNSSNVSNTNQSLMMDGGDIDSSKTGGVTETGLVPVDGSSQKGQALMLTGDVDPNYSPDADGSKLITGGSDSRLLVEGGSNQRLLLTGDVDSNYNPDVDGGKLTAGGNDSRLVVEGGSNQRLLLTGDVDPNYSPDVDGGKLTAGGNDSRLLAEGGADQKLLTGEVDPNYSDLEPGKSTDTSADTKLITGGNPDQKLLTGEVDPNYNDLEPGRTTDTSAETKPITGGDTDQKALLGGETDPNYHSGTDVDNPKALGSGNAEARVDSTPAKLNPGVGDGGGKTTSSPVIPPSRVAAEATESIIENDDHGVDIGFPSNDPSDDDYFEVPVVDVTEPEDFIDDTIPTDPSIDDPITDDPTPVGPTPVDPTPVDPTPIDPTPVGPTPVDPTPVVPEPTDPVPVVPDPIDPGNNDDPYVPDDGGHSGSGFGGYDEFNGPAFTIDENFEDFDSIADIIARGNGNIPDSFSPIRAGGSGISALIPISAGLSAAAAVGLGTKAIFDKKNEEEELLEEEEEDDNLESYLFDDETDEDYEQTFDEDDDYLYSYEETLLDY
ncbi:MAG: hypothetical protein IJ463_00240 [Bacilli bacterium]|nr:hypothetical protein [Bacilli bacterium]